MLREGFPELTSLEMLESRVEARYIKSLQTCISIRICVAWLSQWVLRGQCFIFGALYPSKSRPVHKHIVENITLQRSCGMYELTAALGDNRRSGFYDMSAVCSAFLNPKP